MNCAPQGPIKMPNLTYFARTARALRLNNNEGPNNPNLPSIEEPQSTAIQVI